MISVATLMDVEDIMVPRLSFQTVGVGASSPWCGLYANGAASYGKPGSLDSVWTFREAFC